MAKQEPFDITMVTADGTEFVVGKAILVGGDIVVQIVKDGYREWLLKEIEHVNNSLEGVWYGKQTAESSG